MTLRGKPCPTCGRPLPETAQEKLDRLVDRTGGADACWPYRGRRNRHGYGMIDVYRAGRVAMLRAHRVAFEAAYGPIPDGLVICHVCDNPPCCNPRHLSLGTVADNIADMWRKGRQPTYTNHRKGEGVGTSKLTAAQVVELRRRFAAGGSAKGLAPAYGISQATAYNVIHGVTWGHLPGAQPTRGRGRGGRRSEVNAAAQVRGERSGNAELTEAAVLAMRQRFAAGEQAIALAAAYGIGETTAWNAIHGVTWAHVPGAVTARKRRGWPKGKRRRPAADAPHDDQRPSP